ncbi:hypothetical protein GW916_06995 [bacterium]|nr:hypothetical protein [bacterium]
MKYLISMVSVLASLSASATNLKYDFFCQEPSGNLELKEGNDMAIWGKIYQDGTAFFSVRPNLSDFGSPGVKAFDAVYYNTALLSPTGIKLKDANAKIKVEDSDPQNLSITISGGPGSHYSEVDNKELNMIITVTARYDDIDEWSVEVSGNYPTGNAILPILSMSCYVALEGE